MIQEYQSYANSKVATNNTTQQKQHTAPVESLPPHSKNMPSDRALAVAYLHIVQAYQIYLVRYAAYNNK